MRKPALIMLISVITITACSSQNKPLIMQDKIAPVSMTGYTESSYTVYTKEGGYSPAAAEPDNGCYVGAYVLSNRNIDFDMNRFDELTKKAHAFSVYNMRLGDQFPYEWVLECIALMKTPYIIVLPPNEYSVFQEELLNSAAKDFSELFVPIFVDFYPDPHKYTDDYALYTNYYKKAYDTFKLNAPNTIFVMSADSEHVYDFDFYYPGDDYVDWLGINVYVPLYKNGVSNTRNYMKDIDYFYSLFQRKKPLIVSQLAFSSYSTKDHRYFSAESAKKLTDFYLAVKNDYTRIKAVNYMDFNNIDGAPKSAERDNFSISQNSAMLNSYSEQMKDSHFLSETSENYNAGTFELFKSYFLVLEDENYTYIPEKVFSLDLGRLPNVPYMMIDGEKYYSVQSLEKSNIKCTIDHDSKKIYLE